MEVTRESGFRPSCIRLGRFIGPSTAVFVRQNGKLGIVPMNPLDKPGKTRAELGTRCFFG